jgi:hypothetical protein
VLCNCMILRAACFPYGLCLYCCCDDCFYRCECRQLVEIESEGNGAAAALLTAACAPPFSVTF